MPYLNLDPNFSNHPKAMRLNARLGANTHLLMVNLWCFAARFHPDDGNLSDYTPEEIESFAAWAGNKQCFYNACVEVGFIDVKRDGKLVMLHDWKEHQGHLSALRERAQKAAKARWDKIRNQQQNHQPLTPQEDECNATGNAVSNAKNKQAMLDECSLPSSPSSPSLPSLPSKEKKYRVKKSKSTVSSKLFNHILEYFNQRISDIGQPTLRLLTLDGKPRVTLADCLQQKPFTLEQCKAAIDGCLSSKWRRERPERMMFSTIFKDAETVGSLIAALEDPQVDDAGNSVEKSDFQKLLKE